MNIKLLVVFLTGYFLLLSSTIFGQGFCGSTGGFTLSPSQGCAPMSITVKNQVPKAGSISYVYNFNRQQVTFPDKKDISLDSFYVYQNPGTYTILQFGSSEGTGFSLCKDVVVYETRAPKAEVIMCQNGRVRLLLEKDSVSRAYDQIEINWGDGSPLMFWKEGEPLAIDHKYPANSKIPPIVIRGKYNAGFCNSELNMRTLSNLLAPPSLSGIEINSVKMSSEGKVELVYAGIEGIPTEVFIDRGDGQFVTTGKTSKLGGNQSVVIDNLNARQIYRFKLISKDFCDNPVESAVVSTAVIEEGAYKLDEINSLIWKQPTDSEKVKEYQLVRDGKVIFTTPDQLSYLDSDVKCGVNYNYEVVAILADSAQSHSAPFTITPKASFPEIINNASISVEDENLIVSKVELSGKGLTSTYDLIIERANLGSLDFQKISGTANASLRYEDRNVNTFANSYCYRFSYKNACNLSSRSFSEPVCSILLANSSQEITWTAESPFTAGVASYDLMQMDASGNVINEIPKELNYSQNINLDLQSAFSFRIKAHSLEGNLLSYSNILNIKREAIFLIPDAFTPNGDGINEKFEVKSYFSTSFMMSIYSRWGEMVFHSESAADGWDGNIEGKPAPAGYYTFKITALNNSKGLISKNGGLLLIR